VAAPSRRLQPDATVDLVGGTVEWAALDGDTGRAPLLLLHEGLGSITQWREFPHLLGEATGRRVVAYARFGYGGSGPALLPRPAGFMHTEAMEVLPELVERLGLDRPVLVGHSDGASIALIASATHAVEVEGVVAIAPHVLVEQLTVDAIADIRERYLADDDLRRRLGRHHRDPDAAFWGWNDVWLSAAFRTWTIEEFLPRIRVPVLTVQGDDDPYGSMVHVEAIGRSARGDHQELVLAGVGHSPHVEAPTEVAAAVASFVASLP
jgi:pimeloyl-ACP methyl ester carboxylesterase